MLTKLTIKQLNQRAKKVFDLKKGDYLYGFEVDEKTNHIFISMVEKVDGETISFFYEPDMDDRPQAKDYLLGLRDDFND